MNSNALAALQSATITGPSHKIIMTAQTIQCGYCGATIPLSSGYLIGISPPLAECLRCKTITKLSNTNEWDLRTVFGKLAFLFSCIFLVAIFGIGLGLFLSEQLISIMGLPTTRGDGSALKLKYSVTALTTFAAATIVFQYSKNKIAESRARMSDAAYRKKLQQLGIN